MIDRAVVAACVLVLLALFSLPARIYVNVSSCGHRVTELLEHLQSADAVVVLRPLAGEEWSLFSGDKRLPQALQIVQPDADFMAVNFGQLNLLSGDKVVVRNPNGSLSITVTPANASDIVEEITSSKRSPHSLLLRTHPFLLKGDTVVVEYVPSIMTLMLPMVRSLRDKPVVMMDSYAYIKYDPRCGVSNAGVDTESTVGATDEAKEAICYRKSQPKMYARARAVARLMIRTEPHETSVASGKVTSWAFCTGWLIGRGNHMITNHHCVKNAAVVERGAEPSRYGKEIRGEFLPRVISRIWPHTASSPNKTGHVVEAVVGFMAETKTCRETGYMGQRVGVVEATRVEVVTVNPDLDYALLRVLPNNSAEDLGRRYGYLRLRTSGPIDGETIYIPQHPRGEPKEIAATKDGKPTIIEVSIASSGDSSQYLRRDSETSNVQPTVWYNADTEPGSSGSPVLSYKDNTVVALHRAGYSETAQSASTELFNMGVRIDCIARDLQQRNVLPQNALVS
ncbi:putative IQ and ubiquitin-like domain-containing protein [Phytophthora cinnamomi]|uniref:putative IQ and ubiquitin-like domain-containing protein n=1 Tax=Phytophthora cinnamomi TaxID=4785 RepID=UPI003559756D|nr:putative IQ and ubiquitin-like domain-containing protein [Phytophthora cinnamomi]